MARVQTMVQLSDELVELLDRRAARRGVSRSALIREVLQDSLAEERAAAIDRRIVEGYERIPPGTPDAWGDLEASSEQATVELGQRLDAEERDAGHQPW